MVSGIRKVKKSQYVQTETQCEMVSGISKVKKSEYEMLKLNAKW